MVNNKLRKGPSQIPKTMQTKSAYRPYSKMFPLCNCVDIFNANFFISVITNISTDQISRSSEQSVFKALMKILLWTSLKYCSTFKGFKSDISSPPNHHVIFPCHLSTSGWGGTFSSWRHLFPEDQLHPCHPPPRPGSHHHHHPITSILLVFPNIFQHRKAGSSNFSVFECLLWSKWSFQWQQASCPILYFVIEYKLANQLEWTIGDNHQNNSRSAKSVV